MQRHLDHRGRRDDVRAWIHRCFVLLAAAQCYRCDVCGLTAVAYPVFDVLALPKGATTGGDFYVGPNGSILFADQPGQRGLVEGPDPGNLLDTPIPTSGFIRTGLAMAEGKVYVAGARAPFLSTYIVFKTFRLDPGYVAFNYVVISRP